MLVDLLEIFGEVYHDSLVVVLLCYLPELHLKQKKHEEIHVRTRIRRELAWQHHDSNQSEHSISMDLDQ